MKPNYLTPTTHFIAINSQHLLQAISSGGGGSWDDADAKKSNFWDEVTNDDENLWGSVWED